MPLPNNARTALELPPTLKLDQQTAQILNDRFRTIAQRIDSASSGGTGSGSRQAALSVPGTLGVQSSAAPLLSLAATATPSAVIALVKRPSQGQDIKFQISVGGSVWFKGTVTQLKNQSQVAGGLGQIAANQAITLDLVQVGTTFPGSDLSVLIRF